MAGRVVLRLQRSLLGVIFYGLLWALAKERRRRFACRRRVADAIGSRWVSFHPVHVPGSETGVVAAIMMGAEVVTRSLMQAAKRGVPVPWAVQWSGKILGPRLASGVMMGILAWRWAKDIPMLDRKAVN